MILLKHHKKLNLRIPDNVISLDLSEFDDRSFTIFSFSKVEGLEAKETVDTKIVDGTTRFVDKLVGSVVVVNARSYSPFHATIFWDLAHHLDIGQKIYVYENYPLDCILANDYFSSSFKKSSHGDNVTIFEKIEQLPIENNKGLTSWTFGIPVGPDDPTVLNLCVSRILELGISDFEIILCGIPHKNFKYFDKVKIVGAEISAPPVHITRKKNEIARFATKDNLCILHDRVLLPSNFRSAMEKFGDMYPFLGFQSIYFADYMNLVPRRYSDFGVLQKSLRGENNPVVRDKSNLPYHIMSAGCATQHCLRADFGLQYLTGSLYICKRNLWAYCPQNEEYYWDEFEDIEYGLRAASKGIPSMINPYSLTQSMNSRSIIHYYGYTSIKTINGNIKERRSFSEVIPFLKKKPLFRMDEHRARAKMIKFAQEYISDPNIISKINVKPLDGISRYELIFELVMKSKIAEWEVKKFVNDYCSLLLHEDMPRAFKERIVREFSRKSSSFDKKMLLLRHGFVLNQVSNSLSQQTYMNSANDIFVKKNIYHKSISFLTAFILKYFARTYYFKMSIRDISSTIIDTTPFRGDF
ncbi:TPA: hypothetical protein ACF7ZB_001788 [Kluyvera georgiana]